MNMQGFEKIHESNLEPGKTYFFKNRFGSGLVKLGEDYWRTTGLDVQVVDGGFDTPLMKYRPPQIMRIESDSGKFYEVKG